MAAAAARGAELNAKDEYGRPPLALAAEKGYEKLVEVLNKHTVRK